MKIIRSEILGFCFGVRRAIESAFDALEKNPNQKVYSLGPLIHNEETIRKLEEKGLVIIEENRIEEIENCSIVIIRAHGVAPEKYNLLEKKHCVIIDATCPRVKANQKMVQKYTQEDYEIILTGDPNHGEVIGIAGYAKENFHLIESAADIGKQNLEFKNKKCLLLSQTTFSLKEFEKIQKILSEKINQLEVKNTICPATKERQDSLENLCGKVQGVIVIGGKNSANTIRLYKIAEKKAAAAIHIQDENEIPKEFFSYNTVGITAGASTPDEIIERVEERLKKSEKSEL